VDGPNDGPKRKCNSLEESGLRGRAEGIKMSDAETGDCARKYRQQFSACGMGLRAETQSTIYAGWMGANRTKRNFGRVGECGQKRNQATTIRAGAESPFYTILEAYGFGPFMITGKGASPPVVVD
jgi:hypothetical protein